METIHIAFIGTGRGFEQFNRDISTYNQEHLPYQIKFHLCDDDIHKVRSGLYHSYVVHRTAFSEWNPQTRQQIIEQVQWRIVKIK